VILIAKSFNSAKYGTLVELWHVGSQKVKVINRPFDPFYLSLVKLVNSQPIQVTFIEDLKKHTVYKKEFRDTRELKAAVDKSYTFLDDIPYIQQVAIKKGFKVSSPLPSHYAFDTEFNKGRLIACGWGTGKHREVFTGNPSTILCNLNDVIQTTNPDILDTYWGSYFDVGRLLKVSRETRIPLTWGRDGSEPYIWRRGYSHGPHRGYKNQVQIAGRIHFDVYNEVEMDQTLSGIKNKRLQTVAEWFGFGKASKIDHSRLLDYGMEVVKSECSEDVRKTWLLSEHYLKNLFVLADDYLYLPLNLLVERSPSHIPNYIYMREYDKLGVVSTCSNADRYRDFFVWQRKSYEGAFVKLYNPGIYTGNLKKIDFRSMYPSIMGCFFLDPLTVELLRVKHTDEVPNWIVQFRGDETDIYDKNLRGIFTVRIKTEESVSQRLIRQFMRWRQEVREDKSLSDTEKKSRQWAIKVMMNAMYGYHGMRYARLGCAPIAAYVTAIGRWFLLETIKYVERKKVATEKIIEADTDGVYMVGRDYAKEAEDYIKSLIPSRYDSSFIKITTDTYDGGIFYEEKGYVLKTGESLKFHGSGLVGRHHPKICDKVLEETVNGVFAGKEIKDILWKYTKLKRFPPEDFIMTVELRKHPNQYKEGTMLGKMVKQLRNVELGTEIQYVRTKKGFKPITVVGFGDNLDYDYYRGRIAKALSRILKPTKRLSVSSIEKIIKEGQMVF